MAITRDHNGVLRLKDDPEQPHVALLHHLICKSHNAGKRGVTVLHLHRDIRPVFPGIAREEILRVLLALDEEEILDAEEEGDQESFLHTSTPPFRLEYASTAYRQAISDIYRDSGQGDLFRLLDHADRTMRVVKAAGKDPSRSGELLRKLKDKKADDG